MIQVGDDGDLDRGNGSEDRERWRMEEMLAELTGGLDIKKNNKTNRGSFLKF